MRTSIIPALLCALILFAAQAPAQDAGGLVYVPAYAHIYHGSQNKPFYLTITLSVRNTDPVRPITVTEINYYDTEGELLARHLERPATLAPMQTLEIIIQEKGPEGGSGDNFLVRWNSAASVSPPLIESVMIGTASGQGISFTSRGVEVPQ